MKEETIYISGKPVKHPEEGSNPFECLLTEFDLTVNIGDPAPIERGMHGPYVITFTVTNEPMKAQSTFHYQIWSSVLDPGPK